MVINKENRCIVFNLFMIKPTKLLRVKFKTSCDIKNPCLLVVFDGKVDAETIKIVEKLFKFSDGTDDLNLLNNRQI